MTSKVLINVGCALSVGNSWQNFDASPTLRFEKIPVIGKLYQKNKQRFPEMVKFGDITKSLLCNPGDADAVFCSHMLEHVAYRDMKTALAHIHSMMKPGAVFRLIVPDIEIRARKYISDIESGDNQNDACFDFLDGTGLGEKGKINTVPQRLKRGFRNSGHLWGYDYNSMSRCLKETGFEHIRRCNFGDSEIPEFSEVEDEGRFVSSAGIELAIDCQKP